MTQSLVITTALGEGARDHKIGQPPGDKILLNHTNSNPLRTILGSSGQVVRDSLADIQALNHLMVLNRPSSSISRVHNSNCNSSSSSSSRHCSMANPLRAAKLQQPPQGLDQHSSSSPNLDKHHHRDASKV